jgi:hypothetical protein
MCKTVGSQTSFNTGQMAPVGHTLRAAAAAAEMDALHAVLLHEARSYGGQPAQQSKSEAATLPNLGGWVHLQGQ